MKKRFLLVCAAFAFSATLLLAGCGEGKGAEDTGEDGKVGGTSTTNSTSMHDNTTPTTSGNLMDKAEDLVDDVLPDGNPSTAATTTTETGTTTTNK